MPNNEDGSICYCEVYDVVHSDVSSNPKLLNKFLQSGRSCKDAASYSVGLRKCRHSETYFLQFQKYEDIMKIHSHELPVIGTCLILREMRKSNEIIFKFCKITASSLEFILTLSLKNDTDFERWEGCLRAKLHVDCYPIDNFVHEQSPPLTEECVLHITPHYLCVTTDKEDGNHVPMHLVFPIISGANILSLSSSIKSTDTISLLITSQNNENPVQLKFASIFKPEILKKLETYKKGLISTAVANEDDSSRGVATAPVQEADPNSYTSPSQLEAKNRNSSSNQSPETLKSLFKRDSKTSPEIPVAKRDQKQRSPKGENKQSHSPQIKRDNKPKSASRTDKEVVKLSPYSNVPPPSVKLYENLDAPPITTQLNLHVSIFASEPIFGDTWLLEVVFIRSEDFNITFKSIHESQISSGRHMVIPCRPVKVTTGIVLMLDILSNGFQLMKGGEKHVSYDKLQEITSTSWHVVELLVKYGDNAVTDRDVQFCASLKLVSDPNGVPEEICIIEKFKAMMNPTPPVSPPVTPMSPPVIPMNPPPVIVTFPLKYQERITFCELLDMENIFGKDWKYFADSMGVKQHEIKVIESKGSSYTESVLRHVETQSPERCQYNYVVDILNEMGRRDIIDIVVQSNECAVEHVDES